MEKQRMNLPNRLTLLRIILIPIIVIIPEINYLNQEFFSGVTLANFIVLIIFCIASFTDFLDGYLARKYNLVTDFGKFMDPLADKLLVFAAFIILIENGLPGWIVTVIVAREFMVTGIRVLAANNNVVIAASKLGKAKTVSQMLTIIILLLNNYPFSLISFPMGIIMMYVAVGLTIISGVDYFIKNKNIILKSK